MFWEFFQDTGTVVGQILILCAIGFFLVKKNLLSPEGLIVFSRLIIVVTLPLFIFSELVKNFRFELYPYWWIFPLLSIAITSLGLLVGLSFIGLIKGKEHKRQFLSLIAFQNSGYLPLALIGSLFQGQMRDTLFVYLLLFLLGFNLVVFSLGIYMLSSKKKNDFRIRSLFSPPVVAILFTLIFIFFGLEKTIPNLVAFPLSVVGDCTLPLAMIVVGGSLAQVNLKRIDKKAIFFVVLAKLFILPALGLLFLTIVNLPQLLGILIIVQLAAPSAISSAVILRHYRGEDLIVSQGIFFSHILSLITLPLFLSLYFLLGG